MNNVLPLLCLAMLFCTACAYAEGCATGLVDGFGNPGKWGFQPADSPWVTDVCGTVATTEHVTEGKSALRPVFDGTRGVGKAQISLEFPGASGDFSCGTHVLVDLYTDRTLFLRMDFHDARFAYRMGTFVIVPPGMNRDVRLPLARYPKETLAGFNRLSLGFTGHEPDSTVVFDNLRLVNEPADQAGARRGLRHHASLPAEGNLAGGAQASASSQEGPESSPQKSIDGNPATRWASMYADDQWFELRFDAPVRFNQVVLDWESAYGRAYRVLAPEGEGWRELAAIEDGRGGIETVTFAPVVADRVRVELLRRGSQYGFSFYEIQVRDEPGAEPGVSRRGGVGSFVEPVVNFRPRSAHASRHEGPPEIADVAFSAEIVPLFGLCEIGLNLKATHDNPYDSDDIDVVAEFTGPDGVVRTVSGFFMWPFERAVVAGQEQLRAAEAPEWRVRFTPTVVGEWTCVIRATDRNGTVESEPYAFEAAPSDHTGFVRAGAKNPAYFSTDRTDVFFPIGLNMCWYVDQGGSGNLETLAYDEWLESLAANGGNFVRIWMFSVSFSPEWTETGLGQYDERQPHLWRLDHVLRRCEELGIRVQVCLLNHGQLSLDTNSEWNANPYNAANGGPLGHPAEFLSDETARDMFRRRLRYLMARYAYSPNVFAWEWFNEIENTSGLDTEALTPWVEEMTATVREWDPNGHAITTSSRGSERIYGPDEIAFAQPHMYEVGNWPPAIFATVGKFRAAYAKPVFVGELGIEHSPPTLDPAGRHLHTGNWASLTSGAAGGAMTWWWDSYVAPRDLWHVYRGISAFVAGEPLHTAKEPGRRFAVEHPDAPLEATALDLDDRTLVWIRRTDATATAFSGVGGLPEFADVTGATLSTDRLDFAPARIEWWDTKTGAVIASSSIDAGSARIAVPPFGTDIAAKVFAER